MKKRDQNKILSLYNLLYIGILLIPFNLYAQSGWDNNTIKEGDIKQHLPGILSPKSWAKRDSTFFITYHGILDKGETTFNLVDGFTIWQSLTTRWNKQKSGFTELHGSIGYSLTTQDLLGRIHIAYTANEKHYWFASIQNISEDFKDDTYEENMHLDLFAILFAQRNYKKYYRSQRASVSWAYMPTDARLNTKYQISLEHTSPLENETSFTLFPRKGRSFDTNTPVNNELDKVQLEADSYLLQKWDICYYMGEQKQYNIATSYTLGLKDKGKKHFHKLDLGMHGINGNHQHRIVWSLAGGTFFNSSPFHFSQYAHFKSTNSDVTTRNISEEMFVKNGYELSTMKPWTKIDLAFQSKKCLLSQWNWLRSNSAYEELYIKTMFPKDEPYRLHVGYSLHQLFESLSLGVEYQHTEPNINTWGVYVSLPFMEVIKTKRYFHKW